MTPIEWMERHYDTIFNPETYERYRSPLLGREVYSVPLDEVYHLLDYLPFGGDTRVNRFRRRSFFTILDAPGWVGEVVCLPVEQILSDIQVNGI